MNQTQASIATLSARAAADPAFRAALLANPQAAARSLGRSLSSEQSAHW